jgi:hypothetical protein
VWRPNLERSTVAGHGERGGVGVGAAGVVNVYLSGSGSLVSPRSAYLAQVRRIAPPALYERGPELAELARFCLDAHRGSYVWWRAGPWAGKSALLSTFVLHPPAAVQARVQAVAFFITARLAAQDTRAAFTTVVTEQLAALTGQQPPAVIDESTREAWLLDLLDQAATACQAKGVRLVLVVDGLDEDRGVTCGPDAHSIAALLPADPPAGMRIIVAGRPNPPIPDDVPDWHPLRDPGVIRLLADSPHARDLQRLGRAELKRLLKGSLVEQDLLGLLAAARGGLSGADLHELTGAGLVAIEDVLHTVAGRTFTRRVAQWAGGTAPEVYLLGHEELHNAACRFLGEERLAGNRDRIHVWAKRYRAPDDGRPPWPRATPEYLLRGYTRMLATIGDIPRLVALATDRARHDRMLDLSGGDHAALEEITTAEDLILAGPNPDLEAMALLSIHRNALADRNANIPTQLPAVWATLGQPARAEALARSITDPDWQAEVLVAVAQAVAAAGDHTRAEATARSITDPYRRARALVAVAQAVAAAGDHDRARQLASAAEATARSITDPYWQAEVLVAVAQAAAVAGDHDRAEALARSITDPYWRARALVAVAQALAVAGDHDRAEAIARSITDPDTQAEVLVAVTQAVAAAGDHTRARQLASAAEATARSISNPDWQAEGLVAVTQAAAAAGDHTRARQLASAAEAIARSITDPDRQARALVAVTQAAAAAGDHDRAEAIARSITDPDRQAEVLVAVTQAAAAAGDHTRARQLASAAEATARSITNPDRQARALVAVTQAVAAAGDHDRARRLLGAAFAVGSWLMPLPVLAEHWPQVVLRIADEVYGDDRL